MCAFSQNPDIICTVCGSYRRGAAKSGDIDVLITHPSYTSQVKAASKSAPTVLRDLVKGLTACGFLTDDLANGSTKYMGVCKLPNRGKVAAGAGAGACAGAGSTPSTSPSKKQGLTRQSSLSAYFGVKSLSQVEDQEAKLTQATAATLASNETPSTAAPVGRTAALDGGIASDGAADGATDPRDSDAGGRFHRRIDIRLMPMDSYWCGVLYFTGSQILNIEMRLVVATGVAQCALASRMGCTRRQAAIDKGLHLSEFGLFKTDANKQPLPTPLPVSSERDVFELLDMPYLPPTQRNK